MDTVKIKDVTDFQRDNDTNAIVNTDSDALETYRRAKAKNQRIRQMEERINILNRTITELDQRLTALEEKDDRTR